MTTTRRQEEVLRWARLGLIIREATPFSLYPGGPTITRPVHPDGLEGTRWVDCGSVVQALWRKRLMRGLRAV